MTVQRIVTENGSHKDSPRFAYQLPVGHISRKRIQLKFIGDSLTEQQYKDTCTPKAIIEKYSKMGIDAKSLVNARTRFGEMDITNTQVDNLVVTSELKMLFESLPMQIRKEFNYSMSDFYTFITDPDNEEEAVKKGLINKNKDAQEEVSEPPKAQGNQNTQTQVNNQDADVASKVAPPQDAGGA